MEALESWFVLSARAILARLRTSKSKHGRISIIGFFAVAVIDLGMPQCSYAQEIAFTAEGKLTYKLSFINPARPIIIENLFRVTVVDNRWLIQLTPHATNANAGTKSILVGTDGTNVYQVSLLNPEFDPRSAERTNLLNVYGEYIAKLGSQGATSLFRPPSTERGEIDKSGMSRSKSKARRTPTAKPAWNEATAVVWPGVVPRTGRDFYDLIWLAFGSHDYLKSVAGGRLPTVGMPRPGASPPTTNSVEKAAWTLLADAPRLPQSVRFFNDGYRESNDTEAAPSRHAPPFDQGYVKAEYMVQQTTNVAGLVLPSAFSYRRFSPRAGASSNTEVDTTASWEGLVTHAFVLEGDTDSVPQVAQKTAVADYRVRIGSRAAAASYPMKEGDGWKVPEEINRTPEVLLQREIERRRVSRTSANRNRALAVIVFANLALGAMLVVLWRKRRFYRNDRQTTN